MNTLLSGIIAGAMFCGLAVAQDAGANSTQSDDSNRQRTVSTPQSATGSQPASATAAAQSGIAPGSVIPVQLTKSVDAKKVKTGDEVEAKVTQDLKADSGELILSKDSKVVGHITEAQARTKEQKASQVGIVFDRAVTKNAGDLVIPMSIQAVIAPAGLSGDNNNPAADQTVSGPGAGRGPTGSTAGRTGGMGAGAPSPAPGAGEWPNGESGSSAHPTITANTQGVIGISDLKLVTATKAAQASVLSSEKNNVKLEGGTLLLLRVNQ